MTAVPAIPSVVTAEQMRATGAAIVGMQEADGALPWFPGGQTDPWDQIESAMALSVTGFHAEAEAAYEWSRRKQRDDGSWTPNRQSSFNSATGQGGFGQQGGDDPWATQGQQTAEEPF